MRRSGFSEELIIGILKEQGNLPGAYADHEPETDTSRLTATHSPGVISTRLSEAGRIPCSLSRRLSHEQSRFYGPAVPADYFDSPSSLRVPELPVSDIVGGRACGLPQPQVPQAEIFLVIRLLQPQGSYQF